MGTLKITQTRSIINRSQKQKNTIKALGLGHPAYTTIKPDNPQTRGMIEVVKHLITFEEISE